MDEVYFADVPETHTKKFLNYSTYPYKYTNFIDKDVNRILIMLNSKNSQSFISEFPNFPILGDNCFNCFYNNRTLEITHENVSKGRTLISLLKKINIDPKDILVIGDSANDVSMLKLSKMSIAMKDSDPITLDSVSYITDSEKNMG
jgi:HAD superfamily hydrolase (TIGR01484 family)